MKYTTYSKLSYWIAISLIPLLLFLFVCFWGTNTIEMHKLRSCRGELSLNTSKINPKDKNSIQQIVFAETTVLLKRIISDLQHKENNTCIKADFDKAKAKRLSVLLGSGKVKINDYFESIELQENCKVSAKFINTSIFLPDISGRTVAIGYVYDEGQYFSKQGNWKLFRYTCEFNDKWDKLPSYCKTAY